MKARNTLNNVTVTQNHAVQSCVFFNALGPDLSIVHIDLHGLETRQTSKWLTNELRFRLNRTLHRALGTSFVLD